MEMSVKMNVLYIRKNEMLNDYVLGVVDVVFEKNVIENMHKEKRETKNNNEEFGNEEFLL